MTNEKILQTMRYSGGRYSKEPSGKKNALKNRKPKNGVPYDIF